MTSELERVRQVRPPVAPPSDQAREAARRRLLAAIDDEPAGLHERRARRGEEDRARRGEDRPRPRPRRAPSRGGRRRWAPGALVPVLAVLVTAVVAVGAILLLGHRAQPARPGTPNGPSAGHGTILAHGGQVLDGHDAVSGLPAAVASGLADRYRSQLAAGDALHTSLSLALERAGERSLTHSISVNHGTGGAFVALDPQTGAIEAIGTAAGPHASRTEDRAVTYAGPVGSAFAPITVLAALQSGVWAPDETYDDTGKLCVGEGTCLPNPGGAAYGVVDLRTALGVEDDVFLEDLGDKLNSDAPAGGALQRWASRFGIGHATGIDLPDETDGALPTPQALRSSHPPSRWSVLDDMDLAIGQKQLEVSPVQLAVAYAAIANGGTIVTPSIVSGRRMSSGGTPSATARRVALSASALAAVRAGLRRTSTNSRPDPSPGTTETVFRDFREPVSGEVGTTETVAHGREADEAWYAGYVPASATGRPLVVVVLVQGGGFGAIASAPVARQILSQWFTGRPGRYVPGDSEAQ